VERVDALKGPAGNTIATPDINVVANMAGFAVTTQKKILGADYGLSVIIPVVNTRFTANLFNASAESAGLSDIYFAPVVLGFWEHQIQAGATLALDKPKLWNTSLLTTWEINHSKTGLAIRPGPMFTGEYSFGRRFDKYQMNAGIVGYAYKKLMADSGSGINPLIVGITDRSFGLGPEWKYTNLKWHLGFDFRYEQQFGVQAKTSGSIFAMSITYLKLASPAPAK